VTTLTIYNLREEDEGEYTCKAINSLGEESTSATLLSQGPNLPSVDVYSKEFGFDRGVGGLSSFT